MAKQMILALTVVLVPLSPALCGWMPPGMYHIDLEEDFVREVSEAFPEEQPVNPDFISPAFDPNMFLSEESLVSITFIFSHCRYLNSFGYFTYDGGGNILHQEVLFPIFTRHVLQAGDTVDIGPFRPGTRLGFFIIVDGWYDPNNTRYYTIDDLNDDHARHFARYSSAAYGHEVWGIEDRCIPDPSDEDYNDCLFMVKTTIIPEPSTLLLLVGGLVGLIGIGRRKFIA